MANLAFKSFYTNGEYVDLAEELGITFTVDTNYQIQIQSPATVIVSSTKPTKGGFYIFDGKPFGYTHTGDTLWIKSSDVTPATVNVAEG